MTLLTRTIELVFLDLEERVMRVLCKTEDMYDAECKVVNAQPPSGLEGKKFKLKLSTVLHDHCIVKLSRPDIHVLGIVDWLLNPVNEMWIISGWLKIDPDKESAEFIPGIPGKLFWIVLNARDMLQKFSHYIKDDDVKKLLLDASMGATYWRGLFYRCCDELNKMQEFAVRVKDETLKFMIEQAKKNIELRREIEEALGIEVDPYLYIVWKRRRELGHEREIKRLEEVREEREGASP